MRRKNVTAILVLAALCWRSPPAFAAAQDKVGVAFTSIFQAPYADANDNGYGGKHVHGCRDEYGDDYGQGYDDADDEKFGYFTTESSCDSAESTYADV